MKHPNVTMNVRGVKLLIEVMPRSDSHPNQVVRRFCVRQAQPKDTIDEILDSGVLAEIDKRIKGGEFDREPDDEIPFDVPTAGGAG